MQNTGEALFITDLAMVLAACFVFDLYTALYSFVGLTVKSLVVDAVLEQMKMCKAILIICDDKDPICDFVMRKLVRGATYTPCYGAYTDHPYPPRGPAATGLYPQREPQRLHLDAQHHRSVRQGLQSRIKNNRQDKHICVIPRRGMMQVCFFFVLLLQLHPQQLGVLAAEDILLS